MRCRLEEVAARTSNEDYQWCYECSTSPPTTVGSQDPLNDFSGQKFELTPVQMKNENQYPR